MVREITSSTRTFKTSLEAEKQSAKKPRNHKLPLSLPWLIVAALVLFSLFMVWQYYSARQKLQSGSQTNSQAAKDIIGKVSRLAVVPNETPTVAPITDLSKLKGQSFFANAKTGDVVLVYGKAREAVLYRPSTNQIVTISNVSVSPNQ